MILHFDTAKRSTRQALGTPAAAIPSEMFVGMLTC